MCDAPIVGCPANASSRHGREDPQAPQRARIARRDDEHGFREIELARDGLHRGIRKCGLIAEHRQRVAAEGPIREDVEREVA